jgi:large subunit ribosomal protein L5
MADNENKKGPEDEASEKPERPAKAEKASSEKAAKGGAEAPAGEKPKAAKGEGGAKAEAKAKAEGKGEKPAKGGAPQKGGGKAEKGAPQKGGKEKKEAAKPIKRTAPPRLKTFYAKEVVPRLVEEFKYKNANQVPKLVKITVNMGVGEAITAPKVLESAVEELKVITGQAPVVTHAKKSIATFKLRQGMKIGCMVTLRREKMYEFFDRLVSLALPRVRDFKGISPKSFDGRGNFSLGIREQIIFPEINYDKIDKIKGLNVSIVTTARTDDEGRALLKAMGMPFRQPGAPKE